MNSRVECWRAQGAHMYRKYCADEPRVQMWKGRRSTQDQRRICGRGRQLLAHRTQAARGRKLLIAGRRGRRVQCHEPSARAWSEVRQRGDTTALYITLYFVQHCGEDSIQQDGSFLRATGIARAPDVSCYLISRASVILAHLVLVRLINQGPVNLTSRHRACTLS